MKKRKKNLASISVKNLQFIFIFFCGKTTNLPSFIPGKNLIFFFFNRKWRKLCDKSTDRWDKLYKYHLQWPKSLPNCNPTVSLLYPVGFSYLLSTSLQIIVWWCCDALQHFDWYIQKPPVHFTGWIICICIVTNFSHNQPSQWWIDLNFFVT